MVERLVGFHAKVNLTQQAQSIKLAAMEADLIQGSDEWKQARFRRIGSSDIPVIMRVSPYKTRRELWEEKTGRRPIEDISRNPHVRRGVLAEPVARKILERTFRVKYATPVLTHLRYPQMIASLDGLTDTHLIEIKTMGDAAFEKCRRTGVVPEHYMMQVQWQLMIARVARAYFVPYKPETNDIFALEVLPDCRMQRKLLAHALVFWRWIERDVPPFDPYSSTQFDEITEQEK